MPDAGMVVGMAAGIPGPPALPVTTPFATSARPTTTKATEPNGLFAALPWLESALSEHGSLTAPNGECCRGSELAAVVGIRAWQNHTVKYRCRLLVNELRKKR